MTTLAPGVTTSPQVGGDDVPINLKIKPVGADRVFNGVLAGASAIVLILMAAVVIFLFANGFNAFHQAGFGLFTDQTWSPDTHHFGMMSLLVGSIAIAILAVGIAAPISIAPP